MSLVDARTGVAAAAPCAVGVQQRTSGRGADPGVLGAGQPPQAIRAEIAAYAERFRSLEADALASVFAEYGIDPDAFPPDAVLVVITALSRIMVLEERLGVTIGHAETRALVERFLARFESDPPA